MSKGPGYVQRAIMAAFEAEPNNAFLLSELCQRTYSRIKHIKKKHRVAVARAAKTIKALDSMKRQTLGGELVFYDPLNVMSYAMARLKSDFLNGNYRNNDPRKRPNPGRRRWNAMHAGYNAGTITEEEMEIYEATFEIPARLKAQLDAVVRNEMTEQQLRERLTTPGTREHKWIAEGGAWWLHTEIRRAEKRGDHERLKQLKTEQDAALAATVGYKPILKAAWGRRPLVNTSRERHCRSGSPRQLERGRELVKAAKGLQVGGRRAGGKIER